MYAVRLHNCNGQRVCVYMEVMVKPSDTQRNKAYNYVCVHMCASKGLLSAIRMP